MQIGLSLPSVTARVLIRKITYLHHLLSSEDESIATSTFKILASQNAYDITLVKQCIFLDSKLKTNCTAQILGGVNDMSSCIRELKDSIISRDHQLILEKPPANINVLLLHLTLTGCGFGKRLGTKAPSGPTLHNLSTSFSQNLYLETEYAKSVTWSS